MGGLRSKIRREYFVYVVDSCGERLMTSNINCAIDEAGAVERLHGRHFSVKGPVSLARDDA